MVVVVLLHVYLNKVILCRKWLPFRTISLRIYVVKMSLNANDKVDLIMYFIVIK